MKKIKYMLLLLALMSGVINITFAEEASTGFKLPEQDIQGSRKL